MYQMVININRSLFTMGIAAAFAIITCPFQSEIVFFAANLIDTTQNGGVE
jgi:hypothetical protein